MENHRTIKGIAMRNILLILLMCLGLTSFSQPLAGIISSSQNNISTGNVIPTSGLVREYLLNGDGVETISATNGTLTGCTPIAGINGEANGALSFNGSSDFISFTATSAYSNMTISCWLNINNVTAAGYFIGYTAAGIRYNGTDFMPKIGTGTSNALAYTKADAWIHFLIERTSSTSYNLYINNSLLGVFTNSTSDNLYVSFLGKRSDGFYYNGKIDNVRIYNRVLTSGERSSLFAEKL